VRSACFNDHHRKDSALSGGPSSCGSAATAFERTVSLSESRVLVITIAKDGTLLQADEQRRSFIVFNQLQNRV